MGREIERRIVVKGHVQSIRADAAGNIAFGVVCEVGFPSKRINLP